jgi:hypothetical protein
MQEVKTGQTFFRFKLSWNACSLKFLDNKIRSTDLAVYILHNWKGLYFGHLQIYVKADNHIICIIF